MAADPRPAGWSLAVRNLLFSVVVLAVAGHGTPGPWDAPRRLVAVGPYRWVRNPIYLAALLVVLGEAGLFLSPPLLLYAVTMAVCCHLFVIATRSGRDLSACRMPPNGPAGSARPRAGRSRPRRSSP